MESEHDNQPPTSENSTLSIPNDDPMNANTVHVFFDLDWRKEIDMGVKRTEVTIETQEVWIVHRPNNEGQFVKRTQGWCQSCEAQVELLMPDEAASLTGQSLRQIFQQIEQMKLHFLETSTGGVMLCLPSLIHLSREA